MFSKQLKQLEMVEPMHGKKVGEKHTIVAYRPAGTWDAYLKLGHIQTNPIQKRQRPDLKKGKPVP